MPGEGRQYAWLGLVFLTEVNVGAGMSSFGLDTLLRKNDAIGYDLTVTHHGLNVRTYVNGDGVYFFSLECDSPLAAYG